MDRTEQPPKIYIGNSEFTEANTEATFDVTEILANAERFRVNADTGHQFLDVTFIPFRKGVNKFGKTHYAIIKDRIKTKEL
jgi:hypothetical protein